MSVGLLSFVCWFLHTPVSRNRRVLCNGREVSLQHVRARPVPFHIWCHTLDLDTCFSKPQWILLGDSMTENYCQKTFWFNHFPVK